MKRFISATVIIMIIISLLSVQIFAAVEDTDVYKLTEQYVSTNDSADVITADNSAYEPETLERVSDAGDGGDTENPGTGDYSWAASVVILVMSIVFSVFYYKKRIIKYP